MLGTLTIFCSTEVTIEVYKNFHSVADSKEMIIDFANFCQKVHYQMNVKEKTAN